MQLFKKGADVRIACGIIRHTHLLMNIRRLSSLLCILFITACCAPMPDSETKPLGENVLSKEEIKAAKSGPVDFVKHVKPVLERKCVMCHNRKALPGHSSFESRREALRTKTLGTYLVPGHPETSLMVANTASTHQNVSVMPTVGERLTKDEYTILRKWVKEGAVWPTGAAGTLEIVR